MKFTLSIVLFAVIFSLSSCFKKSEKVMLAEIGEKAPDFNKQIKIIDKSTGFEMNLPEGFQKMDEQETDAAFKTGKNYVDKVNHSNIDISSLQPNLFKKNDNNYFVINVKDYNESIINYKKMIKQSNITLYKYYQKSLPNAKIDTLTSLVKIDNIPITKFALIADDSSKTKMNTISYTVLLNGKDFTLVAAYLDSEVGKEILNAIESSKFEKTEL